MTQIPRLAVIGLLLVASADARHSASRSSGFLSAAANLQPRHVAMTLAEVEGEWKSLAATSAECSVDAAGDDKRCALARDAFLKSCSTVASAVVQGSSGSRASVKEYMVDVCGQDVLQSWQKIHCGSFAEAIDGSMSDDDYDNRMHADGAKTCARFFQRFSQEEEQRLKEEKTKRQAEEKRLAEERAEAEKKAAEEAAAEKKHLQDEEAKRQAEEAKHRAEEAERQAQEAKRQAEEAKRQAAEQLAAKAKEAEEKTKEAEEKQRQAEETSKQISKQSTNKPLEQNTTKIQEPKKMSASTTHAPAKQ